MLEKVDFPLTNSSLTQFIIDEGYTNYFNVQQSISELIDQGLINTLLVRNTTQYLITTEGKETLSFFHNKLSDAIKHDIGEFFIKNKIEMRNEISIYADYVPEKDEEYTVNCFIKERTVTLFSVSINVLSEEHAKKICENWRSHSDDIYKYVSKQLLE
ncbi:MAG: hypothetical protein K0R15_2135 [Clostridiales bacterium]|jgi:hypothetical protein|nr:hypothetical protein [Clostridiales bacterium]